MSGQPVDQKEKQPVSLQEVCWQCGRKKDATGGDAACDCPGLAGDEVVEGTESGSGRSATTETSAVAAFEAGKDARAPRLGAGVSALEAGKDARAPRLGAGVSALEAGEDARPGDYPDLGDKLEVLEFIGEGGMGLVYKVRDRSLDQVFAVKLLKTELAQDAARLKRFEQEVNSAVNMDHPNLVTVYHHCVAQDGTPYMVMDFVEGSSMAEMLAEQTFIEPTRASTLFLQICDGVAHAHLNGVVHLDLKPSNVLVTTNGKVELAKVSDFGIAQVMTQDTQQISQTEEIVGSLPYMSPEHCRGESLDYRSDVYSLGCLMYEVLTGKPPFVGENPVKTIMKHIQDKPPRLKSMLTRLDIPEGLEKIVLHCLEKNPEHRYQNIEELIKDLELVKDGGNPSIAIQQQQMLNKDSNERKEKHKLYALIAAFVASALYFTHLSQYDTFSQIAYFIESTFQLVVVAGIVVVVLWLWQHHTEIRARISDRTQIRPGDHWLSMSVISALASMAVVIVVSLLSICFTNHIPPFDGPNATNPSLDGNVEAMVFTSLCLITFACSITWFFRRRVAPDRKKEMGW